IASMLFLPNASNIEPLAALLDFSPSCLIKETRFDMKFTASQLFKTSCAHLVSVLEKTSAIPQPWFLSFSNQEPISFPYGGLSQTLPCHGNIRPLSPLSKQYDFVAISKGLKDSVHGSKSKLVSSLSNNHLGVNQVFVSPS